MALIEKLIVHFVENPIQILVTTIAVISLYYVKAFSRLLLTSSTTTASSSRTGRSGVKNGEGETQENEEENDYGPLNEKDVDHIPFDTSRLTKTEMIQRSKEFYEDMNRRRSVRFFSSDPIPQKVMENIIRTGGTAPSGAHTEPWTFALISSEETKRELRAIVEEEEELNYKKRMGDKWVEDLRHLKTDWIKPYIEDCPYVLVVFRQAYGFEEDGSRKTHYYNEISVSIAIGLLLAAIQKAGLCTVTTTPLNAGPQIRNLLGRPKNEKVVILLPVGYPSKDCTVPNLHRKPYHQICAEY